MSDCLLPIHPRTSLRALGFTSRGPVWPAFGGAPDGAPDGAPVTGWTPPASQADFDRIIQDRLSRERAKFADYDELKEKAQMLDATELELSSTADKAAAKAREETLAEVNAKAVPRVVRAEFKAAAKGVLEKEQLDALLEDLDLSKYADKNGEPDEERIAKKIAAFAPKGGGDGGQQQQRRDLGQGQHQKVDAKPGDGGRAAAARRGYTKTA